MNLPSKRKLGATALIVAGIGAFLVPFLLHAPTTQGTSPNPTTTSGNHNNNGGSTTTTNNNNNNNNNAGGGTNNNGSGSGSGCTETKSSDPKTSDPGHDNGQGKDQGNAYGLIKNKMDTTIALVKEMGKADPAFHLHHDTDTDNSTVHGHSHTVNDPTDNDSSCASGEEEHEQD